MPLLIAAIMPLAGGKSTTDLTPFRIRYPAGFKADSTAHYHLGTEHIIILKGTLLVGLGDRTDRSRAVAYDLNPIGLGLATAQRTIGTVP